MYEIHKGKLRESVRAIKIAKRDFENKLASSIKKDTKSFYSYVRSKQKSKVMVGPLKDSNGSINMGDEKAANVLNGYFSSVFTVEDTTNIPVPKLRLDLNQTELRSINISEEMVSKKLVELNTNKSPGSDNIHPKLLYELRNELSKPLTTLFKLSLEKGKVPQQWKDANVIPLFKKGKKDKCENYRPVSLTCIVCKILESIIKDMLVDHLERYKLLEDSQHGFTKSRSCLTNLLIL